MTEKEGPAVDPLLQHEALVRELMQRLGPTCADWPPELFAAMVERLAEITIRYSGRTSVSTYDRRSTDRLIEELKSALAKSQAARGADDAKTESS